MTITEPTTLITDYVLAVFSTVFGILLLRARTHRGTLLWSIGFLTLARAGLTGGSFHGFRLMMSEGSSPQPLEHHLHPDWCKCRVHDFGSADRAAVAIGSNTKWHAAGLIAEHRWPCDSAGPPFDCIPASITTTYFTACRSSRFAVSFGRADDGVGRDPSMFNSNVQFSIRRMRIEN